MHKVFQNKGIYTGYDGEEYINLCLPVIRVSELEGNSIDTLTKDDNGRIDRITWRSVAHDLEAIDLLMYANHIFNPFSVQDGDILNIPFNSDDYYHPISEPALPDGTKHSKSKTGEKEKTYAENIEYLAAKGLGMK